MLPRRSLLLIALIVPATLLAQDAENPPKKTFSVTGIVRHPGKFELRDGMRVSDGISAAGGFADFAHMKKVAIIRDGHRINFNYSDFVHGRNTEQNILLQNGDVIDVP
jgi:polysaccharide export outer membrane protein